MAPDVFRLFHAIGVPLRNIYGSTEIGLLTLHQGDRYDLETVGHWMKCDPRYGPPLEWRVSRRGRTAGARRHRRSAATTASPTGPPKQLDDGWYRTGDAVHLTERGELVFLERRQGHAALCGGHRFPPQFIETRLRFSPFIKDIMTLGDETRDFVAALINIDIDVVARWAEERNIGFSTFTDLSQNARGRAS